VPVIEYVVHRKYESDWRIQKRLFTGWDITYVVKGNAQYTVDGKNYELETGDLFCMPPDHWQSVKIYPNRFMNCFRVNFTLEALNRGNAVLPFPLVSKIGIHDEIIHLFKELAFTWLERQPCYVLKCRAIFLLIIHRLFELNQNIVPTDIPVRDYRVEKILHYILSHFDKTISVKKMADTVGLDPIYFGSLFKRQTGMTLKDYLIHVRVRHAKNLLRSGRFKVNEIAVLCGYNDTLYFYKQFKKTTGLTPSEFLPSKNKY
jgi:AraC-like DNA-binding protein